MNATLDGSYCCPFGLNEAGLSARHRVSMSNVG